MQQHDYVPPEAFAGSAAAVLRCLRELVALTGLGSADGPPVLELQFDDIVTLTSLAADAPQPYLCVSVYLPRRALAPSAAAPLASPGYPGGEWLWDASEGRYIILHDIGIEQLADETSLLDAILAAKDKASAWLLSVS
ncbi:hypothetical protein HF313_16555 [Massilia atriviolacea]|uniref:Uncharacterized protein n=1 Tax=Massilia atriviolacea TaxID=2495579 RepID=A0A430HUA2_9BURK|nr:hypothetical protein [Massilia atriviolacea]RSZ61080.1 hypothetical protein EJB06_02840 [Massilia atriviolacea]